MRLNIGGGRGHQKLCGLQYNSRMIRTWIYESYYEPRFVRIRSRIRNSANPNFTWIRRNANRIRRNANPIRFLIRRTANPNQIWIRRIANNQSLIHWIRILRIPIVFGVARLLFFRIKI